RRDAAKLGDDIWVSGLLGEAQIALRLLQWQRQQKHASAAERGGAAISSPTPGEDSAQRSPQNGPAPIASDAELDALLQSLPEESARALLAHTQRRLEFPEPRVALGLDLSKLAHAAIDISDGLVQDLG